MNALGGGENTMDFPTLNKSKKPREKETRGRVWKGGVGWRRNTADRKGAGQRGSSA